MPQLAPNKIACTFYLLVYINAHGQRNAVQTTPGGSGLSEEIGMDYQAAAAKYGTVEHNGTVLALTQQAYAENHGTDGGVRYYAAAIDAEGNEYRVEWDTTAAWDAITKAYWADPENAPTPDDESLACDWTAPAAVIAL